MLSGFIATLLGLIPLIALKACCNINFGYVFWIFLAAIVSGAVSMLAFAFLSKKYRRHEPLGLKKKVEYYKEIEEDWKRDPELIKVDKKFHPAIFFVLSLATFGILVNIVYASLYVISKYGIAISGFGFLLWVGIISVLGGLGGSYLIREVSIVKKFADRITKGQDKPAK
jgi:MFS family permease